MALPLAPVRHLEDQALMARVQDADPRAFEAIYERHNRSALRHAVRVSGSRRIAEEATQEAFLSLWRSAGAYRAERGALRSWLLTLVHNRCIDCLRREARHLGTIQIDDGFSRQLEAPDRTDDQVAARDEASRARQLVRGLPVEQRTVIELTYFKGLTHTEVAARVGIPLGTVKGRQRLGLKKMRHELVAAA